MFASPVASLKPSPVPRPELVFVNGAEQLKIAYNHFVAMANRKKYITDADLVYIVECSKETPAGI